MNGTNFTLFLLAALVIAAVPGPGIFYVAARTLSGGKRAGIASTFGTALGGLVHVIAGGLGVSAIILASAELFTALKFAGALYLVWLGIKTFREARDLLPQQAIAAGTQRVFREGVLVEALNPKTAAFFLAFIPQFIDPAGGYVALQFIGARPDLGGAQHARRCRRGDDGRDRARRSHAPGQICFNDCGEAPGLFIGRAWHFAGAGAAAGEL